MLKAFIARSVQPLIILFVILQAAPVAAKASRTAAGTLLAANSFDVAAYPADSRGDVSPLALSTDMIDPGSIARDAAGRIYVTNAATSTVTIYAAAASGNVPPLAVIGGVNTQLGNPVAIALDAAANIYVLDSGLSQIDVYPPLGAGAGVLNEAPARIISGAGTKLRDPIALAIDPQGNIYVANQAGGSDLPGKPHAPGTITEYAAGSNGDAPPLTNIRGPDTGLANPVSLAIDAQGKLYAGNAAYYDRNKLIAPPNIEVFAPHSDGDAPPLATLGGPSFAAAYPQALALDTNGNIFVSIYVNGVGDAIDEFAAGSAGAATPVSTLVGAGLFPTAITLDSAGNLYIANSYEPSSPSGGIAIYPPGSAGAAPPSATITSSFNDLQNASGIAVDTAGTIYVANFSGGVDNTGSVTAYPSSGLAATAPATTLTGNDTGLVLPSAIAINPAQTLAVLNDGASTVTEYPPGSSGDAPPSATINLNPGNGDETAIALAFDPAGNLLVANQGDETCGKHSCRLTSRGSISVFPPGSDGDATPSREIKGAGTKLATPSSIAIDQNGAVFVTNYGELICPHDCSCVPQGRGSITAYAPDAHGDASPRIRIAGQHTGLNIPYGITVDAGGNIYVLNGSGSLEVCFSEAGPDVNALDRITRRTRRYNLDDPILVFAKRADGDVAPIRTIGGPLSGLTGPRALAFLPAP